MRYIDADKLREEWLENGENEYVYDTNSVLDSIDSQPTADVVEVKRGEWIKKFKYSYGYDDYYNTECSLCGYKVEKSGVGDKLSLDNFCPNCGADMRGDGK